MKKNSYANISLLFVSILVVLSFGLGMHQYSSAKQYVVSSLNSALQQAVKEHSAQWLSTDTIQTYIRLQNDLGTPITVHAFDKDFAEAITIDELKKKSGIQVRLSGYPANVADKFTEGCLMSDTILWMPSSKEAAANSPMLSFRGYAFCPMFTLLKLSDMTFPIFFFLLAMALASVALYLKKHRNIVIAPSDDIMTVGNLSLCCDDNCIYNGQQQRIKLTPLEYQLMEMFYRSPKHSLSKEDICSTLWPRKDDATETLYALVRRLKKIVESHSNLRIIADRGRAYSLEETLSE